MKADLSPTSGCGNLPLQSDISLARALAEPATWAEFVDDFTARQPRRREKAAAYRGLVESGDALRTGEAVLEGRFHPAPPAVAYINKAGKAKKTIYVLPPLEELLFKIVNRLLQPAVTPHTSAACHSFLPERGARTALGSLRRDPDLATKWSVRLDVRDYFNSIDAAHLMATLPEPMLADHAVRTLLERSLLDPRVVDGGRSARVERKGVMAGTPLGPLLANLYLRDLDDAVTAAGITYARYSDDMIGFGSSQLEAAALDAHIRAMLAARGLEANEAKSGVAAPEEGWDYLGFHYRQGEVDLSANTRRKLRAKVIRVARRLDRYRARQGAGVVDVTGRFVRRLNQLLYGVGRDDHDFCWATWFFPLLDTDRSLKELDWFIQSKIRFAATGRHNQRARKALPYGRLVESGYVPLVSEYWQRRDGRRGLRE